jgi:hypothetical protein
VAKTRFREKNKPVAPKPIEAKVNEPEIPKKILKDFLEEKCNFSELKNISKMRAGFLWQKGNIERYRINVWQTTYELGEICPNTKIIHSWFVFYYPDELMIVDKTIEPTGRKIK